MDVFCGRSKVTHGKWYTYDRSGERHLCSEAWRGIDQALNHGKSRKSIRWSEPMRLLQMLKRGPVFQSDLIEVRQSCIASLRRYYLKDSGFGISCHWCCFLGTKFPRLVERVYQLERS